MAFALSLRRALRALLHNSTASYREMRDGLLGSCGAMGALARPEEATMNESVGAESVGVRSSALEAWEGLEEMREGLRAFLVRHCSDENDVEDVIQETFLRAAHYRKRRRVQCLRSWTMRIALNVLADSKRRGVRTQAQPRGDEPGEPPARAEPELSDSAFRVGCTWLDGEAARELVLHTLARLARPDRTLLDSYYGGEQKTRVAALECGLPQRVVKVRLYRARQRLLRALRHRLSMDPRWGSLAS